MPSKNHGKQRMPTNTRVVHVKFEKDFKLKNFYWLGGTYPEDKCKRVSVHHYNQDQQCYYCLLTVEKGCPAMANGKTCELMNNRRTQVKDYNNMLWKDLGYKSLKESFKEKIKTSKSSHNSEEYLEDVNNDTLVNPTTEGLDHLNR